MTLLEAIGSGKYFKNRDAGVDQIDPNFEQITLTKDQVLSGSWETIKEMVSIDKEELDALRAAANGGSP